MKPSQWTTNLINRYKMLIRTKVFRDQDMGEFLASKEYWKAFNREVKN